MNKTGIALSILSLIFSEILAVSAKCDSIDKPTDLQISQSQSLLLVEWNVPVNQKDCDILYNLRIVQNGLDVESIITSNTSFLGRWPGHCVNVDAVLYATIGSGVSSGLVVTNWYTGNPSELGIIEERMIDVTSTSVVLTYKPPAGFPNCRFVYEMVYSLDGAVIHKSTTTELKHSFNYFEVKLLCKVLNMAFTAIIGDVRGDTYTNNVVTDKFNIDLGAVENFILTVDLDLEVSWRSPKYYESCPVSYSLKLTSIQDGKELFFKEDMFYEWTFNLEDENLYCCDVMVTVTPFMRGEQGVPTSKQVFLAPPSSFGIVQNSSVEVTSTSVVITYEPPLGLTNCLLVYEMVYWVDGVVIHNSSTTELLHSYNYVDDRILCEVVYLELTAITGDTRGDIYHSHVVTDKFVIELGEARDFFVVVDEILFAFWKTPEHYESCPVYYEFRLITVPDGEEVFVVDGMFYAIKVELANVDLLCQHFQVVLTPFMRGEPGISSTAEGYYCNK